jgi:hypothetical protein
MYYLIGARYLKRQKIPQNCGIRKDFTEKVDFFFFCTYDSEPFGGGSTHSFFVCLFLFCIFDSHCVAQAGLKLTILLPPSNKYWDYRFVPQHPSPLTTFGIDKNMNSL